MPDFTGKRGRPFNEHRRTIEGIIYRKRAGFPWHDLPEHFGPWQSVWKRHRRFSADGTWDKILGTLLSQADARALTNWEGDGGLRDESCPPARHQPHAPHRAPIESQEFTDSSRLIMPSLAPGAG